MDFHLDDTQYKCGCRLRFTYFKSLRRSECYEWTFCERHSEWMASVDGPTDFEDPRDAIYMDIRAQGKVKDRVASSPHKHERELRISQSSY